MNVRLSPKYSLWDEKELADAPWAFLWKKKYKAEQNVDSLYHFLLH